MRDVMLSKALKAWARAPKNHQTLGGAPRGFTIHDHGKFTVISWDITLLVLDIVILYGYIHLELDLRPQEFCLSIFVFRSF